MSFDSVYDAFLKKMSSDEWDDWTLSQVQTDLFELLKEAIMRFKFPRVSLEYTNDGFVNDITNDEVQVLAGYMHYIWLSRTINDTDTIRPLYDERDYSPANLLDKLNDLLVQQKKDSKELEAVYYRSIKKQPFPYRYLAEQP